MTQRILNSMTEAERLLIAETERDALAELDEDELLDLHGRIRRARTKYVGQYRRGASQRVQRQGGRGKVFPKNQRARDKAEVFETALARVSRQVSVAAKRSAAELRAERIAAARDQGGSGPERGPTSTTAKAASGRQPRARKTTGQVKKDASSRSMGARRQAKRDSR